MIHMETTEGVRFTLDDDGNVTARSNGPVGWDYSGRWTVVGFLRRFNSSQLVPLAAALAGADIGRGFVVDNDHGTRRVWMGSPGRVRCLVRS